MAKDLIDKVGDVPGGAKTYAAGAGLLALAPALAPLAGKLLRGRREDGDGPVAKAGEKLSEGAKRAVGEKVDQVGGPAGIAKKVGKGMLPGGDGDDADGGDGPEHGGVGKGRRMPVQQAADIGAPLSTVYDEWTQFESWPEFMHRVQQVSQDDETHVTFKTKIWGFTKEYKAEIVEQRPCERIMWRVTNGITHTGVVTFHPLGERLTRVQVTLDVEPGSLLEKAARGMRFVKRAVRADLARFKARLEMEEDASGAWRGTIDDGKVKSGSGSSRARRGGSGGRSERRRPSHGRSREGAGSR